MGGLFTVLYFLAVLFDHCNARIRIARELDASAKRGTWRGRRWRPILRLVHFTRLPLSTLSRTTAVLVSLPFCVLSKVERLLIAYLYDGLLVQTNFMLFLTEHSSISCPSAPDYILEEAGNDTPVNLEQVCRRGNRYLLGTPDEIENWYTVITLTLHYSKKNNLISLYDFALLKF